jgi:small-conductance mechanosensitive channel
MFSSEMFIQPFVDIWAQVATFVPKFIAAILVLLIGMIIAKTLYKLIVKALGSKVDAMVLPLAGAIERAGYKLRVGHIIGWLVKWFFIIVTLIIALDILGLDQVQSFLTYIALYIPRVIIAAFVVFAGYVLGDFAKKLVKGSTKMVNFKSAAMLGNLTRTVVIIFACIIALEQVGIGASIIQTLFTGFVAMIAIAGGLAFGLGGKEAAKDAIHDAKQAMHK